MGWLLSPVGHDGKSLLEETWRAHSAIDADDAQGSSPSLRRPYRRGISRLRASVSGRSTHPAPSAMSTTSMVPSWDGSWPKNRERSYGTSRAWSDSRRTRAKQTLAPSIIERESKKVAQNRPARAVFSPPPLDDSRAEEEKKASPPLDPKWVPRKRMELGLPPRAATNDRQPLRSGGVRGVGTINGEKRVRRMLLTFARRDANETRERKAGRRKR
jgi:hypothetical protein